MILIHDWREAPLPDLYYRDDPTPRVARKCVRCGTTLTLRERDAAVICPKEDEAVKMFSEPVLCEPGR